MKAAFFVLRTGSYLAILLTMLFVEWRAPFVLSEQSKRHRVAFHMGLSLMNSLILALLLAGPTYALVLFTMEQGWGLGQWLGLSGWMEIACTVVAFDIWDYWMHLANHKVPILWRFHKAHHSDMEIDVTTASRFHVGELLISGISKCLMILLWGPSLWGLVIFEALLTSASEFHHSNINLPLRLQDVLERIVVTPRMHRCHHALHRSCFNTNYTAILSVWDRIFRSYHWARLLDELEPIGLFSPRGPSTMKLIPFLLTPVRITE
jgi:sterol desaturase/sphingolipid hydroxylase (fatty acid hydroxylase superfamily)